MKAYLCFKNYSESSYYTRKRLQDGLYFVKFTKYFTSYRANAVESLALVTILTTLIISESTILVLKVLYVEHSKNNETVFATNA